jgi:hypothetical protein
MSSECGKILAPVEEIETEFSASCASPFLYMNPGGPDNLGNDFLAVNNWLSANAGS